ncbi:MAG: DivIVA domain-containing protein [Clostridia bacterium]|nr:DivIVA domain-containing protein [Clostridia bacterium]
MFLPSDLEEISFERAVMGGYKLNEVEDFVNKISSDYVTLYKENEELKKKLKIVVDKIESYRTKESLISEALLSAQSEKNAASVEAARIVDEAKAEAEKIVADSVVEAEKRQILARENADKEIAAINAEVEGEQKHLEAVKIEVSEFKQRIQELYKSHLTNILAIPSYEKPEVKEEPASEPEPEETKEEAPAEEAFDGQMTVSDFIESEGSNESDGDVKDDLFYEKYLENGPDKEAVPPLFATDDTPAPKNHKSGLSDVFDFDDNDDQSPMSFVIKNKKK